MTKKSKPIHLLIVEDNIGDFVLVEEYLHEQFENIDLTHAQTFREAKAILQDTAPQKPTDAILLDLTLPDKKGEDLIDEMIELSGEVPLIIFTGYSDLSFSVNSMAKGVSDYLLKDDLSPALLYKSILYSIERDHYSAKVRASEKNYRDLFELSPQPMLVFDLESFEFLDVNNAAVEKYGYTKEEFLSMTARDIRPVKHIDHFEHTIEQTFDKPDRHDVGVFVHRKKNGELINVKITATNIEYQGRKARIVLADDITEKLKEEERLKLLESVITNTTEAVIILEAEPTEFDNRKILYVNNAFIQATGYQADKVVGRTLNFLYGPETDSGKVERNIDSMKLWKVIEEEIIIYKKDGTPMWVDLSMVPVADSDGHYSHWIAIATDITRKKENESELQESLREKEILLSEIHHRVKNNLAVVSSMMELQSFHEDDDELSEMLLDSTLRIRAMANIHELLYQSGSFSKLLFSDIIEKLVRDIDEMMNDGKEITHRINTDKIELNINQAIPCAIIINEVVSNIYNHAFRNGKKGRIDIDLRWTDDLVKLKISDNGSGFPKGKSADELESLGMIIIKTLTDQLDGSGKFISSEKGTEFDLSFKKAEKSGVGSAILT